MPEKPIAIVSTPWPLYSRPSVQLATLKSYLQSVHPGLVVDTHHLYLLVAAAMGYRAYHDISERTWRAECVYAAMLYPHRADVIGKLFRRQTRASSELTGKDFTRLVEQVSIVTDRFIDSIDWKRYDLVGFSICLCQLTSTLYFIERIKAAAPSVPVVIGGSFLAGQTIQGLLATFPQIDYAIYGEGELPLSRLVESLQGARSSAAVASIPGVVSRHGLSDSHSVLRSQLADLSALPPPDFEDYFQLLQTLAPAKRFFPTLGVEMSRGCWWRKPASDNQGKGCAFCNLNLQWEGYRFKRPDQVADEIETLARRHQTLSVAFVDNLIPMKTAAPVFDTLAASKKDYRLFCEIRAGASTSGQVLEKMKNAGVVELQIGIEALSTRLLGKLNKGTTVMDNLHVMKQCEALGLVNISNLIMGFPGSDPQDVEETLYNLTFAMSFRPMRAVDFWLGIGSPVWQNPGTYDVRAVFNHPNWSILLPPEVAKHIPFMIQAYRGDRTIQKKRWKPVKAKLAEWAKTYYRLRSDPQASPILGYRDGKEFLIIHQKRPDDDPLHHRLVGASRQIYLFCGQPRNVSEIRAAFPSFGSNQLHSFLSMMVDKKLMFTEDERYLSLAIPARSRRSRSESRSSV